MLQSSFFPNHSFVFGVALRLVAIIAKKIEFFVFIFF